MSQSYNKPCMFCKHEIVMSDKGAGKWLPYDLNGSVHECKTTSTRTGTKKVEKNGNSNSNNKPLTLEALDVRLKRVEAMFVGGGPQK